MLFTPIYIALTFIKTWRIRSFRARLLEFLSDNTSVAFCKVPENAAETPTLSSKLCTNPNNAYLCDVLDYTNATRICSMRPHQTIDIVDWVACAGGLPLGSQDPAMTDCDVELLFECEMEPHRACSYQDVTTLDSVGQPIAWKADSHLAIVLRTNIEKLSMIGFHFVGSDFVIDHMLPVVRIQSVRLSGEPNKATDPSMRSLRYEIQQSLSSTFEWSVHAALLRKLSKVVDIKSETKHNQIEMNGTHDHLTPARRKVVLADVSCNTGNSLNADDDDKPEDILTISIEPSKKSNETTGMEPDEKKIVLENVTVEIKHNIAPKKSSLKLDLKKSTSQLSSSLMNISSQIHSVTTHKRIVSTTGPRKVSSHPEIVGSQIKEYKNANISSQGMSHPEIEGSQIKEERINSNVTLQGTSHTEIEGSQVKQECINSNLSLQGTSHTETEDSNLKGECRYSNLSLQAIPNVKTTKHCRPLVNTKSPNVLIYSDSETARDNLEQLLRTVLDCDRYTIRTASGEWLAAGAWRRRVALVAVAGDVGRCAPLLLAHLLDGGRMVALCSDLLHTVLPYYKTAEIRENEVVQFTFDKWKSVRMKHHIFCYQASPAKKQFSTESDRQPSKYSGHPGHELDIRVLASEETWKTPSLLQAVDRTNGGIAIFSQIHLEVDPGEYLADGAARSNQARLAIVRELLGDILGLQVADQLGGGHRGGFQYREGSWAEGEPRPGHVTV